VIVLDASAAVAALLNDGEARGMMATESVHVPHLIDAEVPNGLRRQARSGSIPPVAAWTALDAWRRAGVRR
jgi:predicted nucleic acid-binding protein